MRMRQLKWFMKLWPIRVKPFENEIESAHEVLSTQPIGLPFESPMRQPRKILLQLFAGQLPTRT